MTEHRRYTRRQKVTAVLAADMATAMEASEQTGIPRKTIAYWMDKPEFAALRHKARESLAEEMAVIARLAAQKLMEAVIAGRLEPRDLITALGVATDKMQLLSGQATDRLETRDVTATLDDHERARLRDILDDALRAAAEATPVGPGVDAP